jgi:hypothetical protein
MDKSEKKLLMLALFNWRIKNKKIFFKNHIDRLERLVAFEDVNLVYGATVDKAKKGREFEDYELDNYIEDRENLKNFEDLIREQMFVSICGYFEYAIRRLLNELDQYKSLQTTDRVLKIIKDLEIIDKSTFSTCDEYNIIRNTCVHLDSVSTKKDSRLKNASKFGSSIKGFKLKHIDPNKQREGAGRVQIEKNVFLSNALEFHFKIIPKVSEYVRNK